jgi:hypothetical protein
VTSTNLVTVTIELEVVLRGVEYSHFNRYGPLVRRFRRRELGVDLAPLHRAGGIADARRALGTAVVVLKGQRRMMKWPASKQPFTNSRFWPI